MKTTYPWLKATTFVNFEWHANTSDMVKYYYAGGQRLAMRKGNGTSNANLQGDHPSTTLRTGLGSASVVANADGTLHSEQRYDPWGEVRWSSGTLPTDYTYTGQYSHMGDPFKLMFYKAR
ncbi:MAG: hypothetical protein Fur0022_29730 [Anaerolineales bacterium]